MWCSFHIRWPVQLALDIYLVRSVSFICRNLNGHRVEVYYFAVKYALFDFLRVSGSIDYMYFSNFCARLFPLLFSSFQPRQEWYMRRSKRKSGRLLPFKDRKWRTRASENECGRSIPANDDRAWMAQARAYCSRRLTFWTFPYFSICVASVRRVVICCRCSVLFLFTPYRWTWRDAVWCRWLLVWMSAFKLAWVFDVVVDDGLWCG